MAGFDFDFPSNGVGRPLERALLRWSQRTAKELGLKLTWRASRERTVVEVDGQLPLMWALHNYLVNDFEPIASSYPVPERRRDRLRLAKNILNALTHGLSEHTTTVHVISDLMSVVPNSVVFDYGPKTHLAPALRSLTRMSVLDMQGRVPKGSVIEVANSALEQVLKSCLGRFGRGLTHEKMIDIAVTRGVITSDQALDLHRLRLMRNSATHTGQGFGDVKADGVLERAIEILHHVLAKVRAPEAEDRSE